MNTTEIAASAGEAPKSRNADEYVRGVCEANPNKLISHYLIHSYLYYERDTNIISDLLFAHICKDIALKWSSLSHPHKLWIRDDILKQGTYSGFYLKDYPTIVKSSAIMLAREYGECLE